MCSRTLVVSVFATVAFTLPFTTPVLGLQETSQVHKASAVTDQKTDSAASGASSPALTSEKEKKSYALGMNMGEQLKVAIHRC